jgi:hypothetical protein
MVKVCGRKDNTAALLLAMYVLQALPSSGFIYFGIVKNMNSGRIKFIQYQRLLACI